MIKHINLDPNGLCNAKCWFCPVAYLGNPKENRTNMSIETMEDILKQIDNGRGDFVDPDIQIKNNPIHFNEILLYPYFKEMLDLHRKYNIKMYVFSNGLNLTPEKTELIKEYSDVVTDVLLNIPSIEKTQWSNFTGFNIKLFDKLIDNISYANNNLYPSFSGEQLMIFVNGLDNNKNITKLKNAPIYKDGELIEITKNIQKMFPNFRVMLRNNLSDRTNILSELEVISNQDFIKNKNKGQVVACGFKYPEEHLYISSTGNVYLCCADFSYESVYANIKEKSIKEIWESKERKDMIKKSYNSMCTTCLRAVWSEGPLPILGSRI